MEFLRTIRKSIYDRAFYAEAKTVPFGSALKQYSLFVLCIAFITSLTIYASFLAWSSEIRESGNLRADILSLYPDELTLTFQSGQVSSNVDEPYSIPMPKQFGTTKTKNILVINTRGPITASDFDRYSTSAILGNDALWIYDAEKNKIEIQKLDRFSKESIVVNKEKVTVWTDCALSVGQKVVMVLLVFLPLLLFVFLWMGYLLYLLFGAVIIWIVGKMRKVDLTYSQSYKLGLSLITLPIIYSTLAVGPLSIFRVPFGFTLILAIVAYINFAPEKVSGETEAPKLEETEPTPETVGDTEPSAK